MERMHLGTVLKRFTRPCAFVRARLQNLWKPRPRVVFASCLLMASPARTVSGFSAGKNRVRSDQISNVLQRIDFHRGILVFAEGADAESSQDFIAAPDRNAQRAANAGLFGSGFGDAAGIRL